ncbi:hypothetical protein ICM05_01020 [Leucobacter sp. cx-42]|uniref:hypothetical protein n=1 Tax=unclassified Leucobacter TaxID=2621730 RepID=UPI00165DFD5A|nr:MULTISPECIES: hypothetical protein [unclassified Leucobacter]MBC9953229.1 hypothetical protein [Leucobacter sp. cx-42]
MFDELMMRVDRMRSDIAGKPDFRWGIVTAVSPLAIRLDGDTEPLAGVPSSLSWKLLVGDRVYVSVQNRRATIVGSANGGLVSKEQKTLWSGVYYMLDTHSANLNERVSEQLNGIVLAWSRYVPGDKQYNDNWTYFFVPKAHIGVSGAGGLPMLMPNAATAANPEMVVKYVYVEDTVIKGHSINATAPRNTRALRYVFGV